VAGYKPDLRAVEPHTVGTGAIIWQTQGCRAMTAEPVRRRVGGLEHKPYGDQRLWEPPDAPPAERGDDNEPITRAARCPEPPACVEYVRSEFDGFSMRLSFRFDIATVWPPGPEPLIADLPRGLPWRAVSLSPFSTPRPRPGRRRPPVRARRTAHAVRRGGALRLLSLPGDSSTAVSQDLVSPHTLAAPMVNRMRGSWLEFVPPTKCV
jgi:hypothetical protein